MVCVVGKGYRRTRRPDKISQIFPDERYRFNGAVDNIEGYTLRKFIKRKLMIT